MRTVWVVEQGCYSDYRVVGVYSSKDNAQLVCDRLNRGGSSYDEASIAEWNVDPGVDALRKRYDRWTVHMLFDGSVEWIKLQDSLYEVENDVSLWERTKAPAYEGKGVPDCLNATVWARDQKHAVKIVNEIRTQWIAEGKWK